METRTTISRDMPWFQIYAAQNIFSWGLCFDLILQIHLAIAFPGRYSFPTSALQQSYLQNTKGNMDLELERSRLEYWQQKVITVWPWTSCLIPRSEFCGTALRSSSSGLQHPFSQLMRMLMAGDSLGLPSAKGSYLTKVTFPLWGQPACNDLLIQGTKPFSFATIWENLKGHSSFIPSYESIWGLRWNCIAVQLLPLPTPLPTCPHILSSIKPLEANICPQYLCASPPWVSISS